MPQVTISNIRIGLNIINSKGQYGFISECDDPHNVKISVKDGSSYYCSIIEGSKYHEVLNINI